MHDLPVSRQYHISSSVSNAPYLSSRRKVKCDEAKPTCERCRAGGRFCEAYPEPPPPKTRLRRSKYSLDPSLPFRRQVERAFVSGALIHPRTALPPPIAPQIVPAASPQDCRGFDYFRLEAIQDLSGCFDHAFWSSFVLQASLTEPCIWHAVLALSASHESYKLTYMNRPLIEQARAESQKCLSLKQYTKAVSLLVHGISTQQPRLTVVLISCIIFIYIEFVQDNLDAALNHLKSGLKLVSEPQPSSLADVVDESIIQLLTRLHAQAIIHGHRSYNYNAASMLPLSVKPKANLTTIKDVSEAHAHLRTHITNIFAFHRQTEDPRFVQDRRANHPFPDPLSIEATCQKYARSLQEWQATARQFSCNSFHVSTAREAIALAHLELQCLFAADSVATVLTTSQMIYDEHQNEYERILSLVEIFIQRTRNRIHVFSFDTGVLLPLFYLVLKCRDLNLRMRAIEFMRQAPSQEGLWKRQSIIDFAIWKVKKEEEGRGEVGPTGKLPHHARIFAEGAREQFIDGKRVTVVRYKRGSDAFSEEDVFEEDVTTLDIELATLLGSS